MTLGELAILDLRRLLDIRADEGTGMAVCLRFCLASIVLASEHMSTITKMLPLCGFHAAPSGLLTTRLADHPSVPMFFYARFHCKTLRGRAMRGLGCDPHIEQGAVSSRLTYPPPVS